jgi:RNA polymerase sigma factor (sigma-70 family)
MEARPGEEPAISREASQPIADKIAEAMNRLGERERWIVNGTIYEKKTLRTLAAELGLSKTQVARIRDFALNKLARYLEPDDEIREYHER